MTRAFGTAPALETISSDDEAYGGSEPLTGGPSFTPRLPACGLKVFVKIS